MNTPDVKRVSQKVITRLKAGGYISYLNYSEENGVGTMWYQCHYREDLILVCEAEMDQRRRTDIPYKSSCI